MPHLSLWTDIAATFAGVAVVIMVIMLMVQSSNRRPRPASRKAPERSDARLAEILGSAREAPTGLPVQGAMQREAKWQPVAEERVARAERFYRQEEPPVESEPDAESSEVWHSLKDRYAMYLRDK